MAFMADWPSTWQVALLLSGMFGAAVLGIRLAQLLHVPRVLGYLLFGMALHVLIPWCLGDEGYARFIKGALPSAEVIKSVALSFILFAIGIEFDVAQLKAVGAHVWKLTLAETVGVGTLVFGATWFASGGEHLVEATFLAIAAVATAPAATLHVLRQYEAKGQVTHHILAMTGLNNLVAIVLFYVAFLVFAETGAIHVEHLQHHLVVAIVLATVGSALLGFVLGMILAALHALLTRFETILLFLGVMLVVSTVSTPMGLNALIVSMFIGVAFTNLAIQPHRFRQELAVLAAPLLVIFFVLAGFKIDWSRMAQMGWVGAAFLVARLTGKIGGVALGAKWAGTKHGATPQLGWAMLCQAGVAIGLGKYLTDHWGHEEAGHWHAASDALAVNTVILASVAFFELLGPLAVKHVVVRAGEVKAISLFARPAGSVRELQTIAMRFRRLFFMAPRPSNGEADEHLSARHVMRTNVETLPESAKMAQVLHFVERNRLNHFFVVDEHGELVGTINFRDLRNMMFNPMMAQVLTSYDMANTAPVTALANQPLRELLELFHRYDVGSLPVIEDEASPRLLGVVEQRDVLRALHTGETGEQEEADAH